MRFCAEWSKAFAIVGALSRKFLKGLLYRTISQPGDVCALDGDYVHKLTDFGREVWKCECVCVGSKQVEMEIQIEVIGSRKAGAFQRGRWETVISPPPTLTNKTLKINTHQARVLELFFEFVWVTYLDTIVFQKRLAVCCEFEESINGFQYICVVERLASRRADILSPVIPSTSSTHDWYWSEQLSRDQFLDFNDNVNIAFQKIKANK